MVTGKQLKAAILARRTAQGPRKKRTRPELRQYTVADLERARSGGGAPNPQRPQEQPQRRTRELELAQLELSVIESQLRLRGLPRSCIGPHELR
jgi:hypothetical protein